MGIGNWKYESNVSSIMRSTSTAEEAQLALFAPGFHVCFFFSPNEKSIKETFDKVYTNWRDAKAVDVFHN